MTDGNWHGETDAWITSKFWFRDFFIEISKYLETSENRAKDEQLLRNGPKKGKQR